ncbi:MAG: endonuclease/exonuclease/phosphatase family protein [Gammaproteobacteria bacterium]|nr:endonuclease/exonuclease/phosphatase family protein [Gammaproteobacteria bacterium]
MRVVAWNIRAGGGRRIKQIAAQLVNWAPDVIVLSEFRGTPASQWLAAELYDAGFTAQCSSTNPSAQSVNALLVAARCPTRVRRLRNRPDDRERWMCVTAALRGRTPVTFGAMHVPNYVSGRKLPFHDAVLTVAQKWRFGPGLLLGDTNTGMPDIDEERPVFSRREAAWIEGLSARGWEDVFRHLHPTKRDFTWYSPNGNNGFRLDQAFANQAMLRQVKAVRHEWSGGTRTAGISDHAALIVDLWDVGDTSAEHPTINPG